MRKQFVLLSIISSLSLTPNAMALDTADTKRIGASSENITVVESLTSLALSGDPEAERKLGELYEDGQGMPKDRNEAAKWYEMAAMSQTKTNDESLLSLHGSRIAKDINGALSVLSSQAAGGDAEAMNNLGFVYQHGIGVARNYEVALDFYEKGAKRGNSDASNNLGFMLIKGEGTPADPERAESFFAEAAAQGNAHAIDNLGWMCWNGRHGQKSPTQAIAYFRKAAANGVAAARFNLAALYENGLGVGRDVKKSETLFKLAASSQTVAPDNDLEVVPQVSAHVQSRVKPNALFTSSREQTSEEHVF